MLTKSQTLNNGFSERLNEELDKALAPSKARPKQLAEITGKTIPGARKWLTANVVPKGDDLDLICEQFKLDIAYLLHGTPPPEPEVNVILQSRVFMRVYEVGKGCGIDVHNENDVSHDTLQKTYKVLMRLAAKHPNEELDSEVIKALLQ